jgi:hypothetical protein
MVTVEYIPDYRRNRNGMRNYCRLHISGRINGVLYCETNEVDYYLTKYGKR